MNILLVSHRIPWPLRDGGSWCMYQSLSGFERAGESVGLVSLNTSKHFVKLPIEDSVFQKLAFFDTVNLDNEVKPIPALKNLWNSESSYIMERFQSDLFYKTIKNAIVEFQADVVQFEMIYSAWSIAKLKSEFPDVKMSIRTHNVEHQIWKRLSQNSKNPFRKWYYRLLYRRLKKEEIDILSYADIILAISQEDKDWMSFHFPQKPILVFPFATTQTQELTPTKHEGLHFYHLGSMDWQPNVEAMRWWTDDIWPAWKDKGNSQFFMAGKDIDKAQFHSDASQGIHIIGEVDDVRLFLSDQDVLVVPLLSGGGMRIKILEAMNYGILVLATSVALEGVSGIAGEHFLVAETASDFVNQMDWILHHPEERKRIQSQAKEMVRQAYDLDTHIQEVLSLYR